LVANIISWKPGCGFSVEIGFASDSKSPSIAAVPVIALRVRNLRRFKDMRLY
jgi:hypothetical protein